MTKVITADPVEGKRRNDPSAAADVMNYILKYQCEKCKKSFYEFFNDIDANEEVKLIELEKQYHGALKRNTDYKCPNCKRNLKKEQRGLLGAFYYSGKHSDEEIVKLVHGGSGGKWGREK